MIQQLPATSVVASLDGDGGDGPESSSSGGRQEGGDQADGHGADYEGTDGGPWDGQCCDAVGPERLLGGGSPSKTQGEAEQGAMDGDEDRFEADKAAQLTPRGADGPEETDLSGAFDDRQRQGIDHAEHGDDDGQRQQS